MGKKVDETLATLKDLGTPSELRGLANQGYGLVEPLPANAHIHLPPNFSAFETVEQAIDLASDQNISVLGVSNYYDFQVYGEFSERAREKGIFCLFGLEIICMQEDLRQAGIKVNDPGNPGKTYLCGKGITRFGKWTSEAERLINTIRQNDRQRMQEMIALLNATFNKRGLATQIDENAVIDMIVRQHQSPRETVYLQERHASQAFQEFFSQQVPTSESASRLNTILGAETKAGLENHVAIQNDIRSHLMKAGKPAFVDESFLSFEEAQQLILELGGIPSYPTLADGTSPICDYEADIHDLVRKLHSRNVHAAEWIPVRNSPAVVREYVTKMRDAGLLLTSGTEHNTLDLIPLAPTCNDQSMPADLQAIFWEGACVVVAHQFLTLHGECGYVDANGNPNPEYATADERIRSLAQVGAAVLGKYQEACSAPSQS
ncbi:MAG: hypothetical protein CMJ72_04025 [Planctomycetaceae bacterium]|nr:hypothetical protein [Planctomycetaceae bacterium]